MKCQRRNLDRHALPGWQGEMKETIEMVAVRSGPAVPQSKGWGE
jgi:hypothetical protein